MTRKTIYDLTGKRFGKLLVLDRDTSKNKQEIYWLCKCDCGKQISTRYDMLVKRNKTCCGCSKLAFDIGYKFNKITVISRIGRIKSKSRQIYWKCKCDCGKIITVPTNTINKKTIKSCGCDRVWKYHPKKDYLEGLKAIVWNRIVYGAEKRDLEITISPKYLYELYLKQNKSCALSGLYIEMQSKARVPGTASLDRIDNSLGYIEGNVQWVHKDINQMKNKHNQEHFIKLCTSISDFQKNKGKLI
jgi:hypothetical protein